MPNDLFILFVVDNYWKVSKSRRKFFVEFAAKKGFDPYVSGNWDTITKRDILKQVRKKKCIGASNII